MHASRGDAGLPAPQPDVSGRVLIAEDDPTLCGLISEILGGLGHEVHICAQASQILLGLDESTPDLLILNPALAAAEDGDLLGTLRTAAPRLPILIITTRADRSRMIRGHPAHCRSATATWSPSSPGSCPDLRRAG
jgi:CheY-like chemotaxis protein